MSNKDKQHNYKKSTIISVGNDKPKSNKSTHYVKNADFYDALVNRKKQKKEAEESGRPKPKVSEFIGHCILQIATNLSTKSNFVNYKYREEMVNDAVLNCIQYVDNFDPAKSKNPFSYFTQVCYYAFIGRIANEKKQTYVKFRSTINTIVDSAEYHEEEDTPDLTPLMDGAGFDNEYMKDFVDTYEQKNNLGIYKKPRATSRGKSNLESAIPDDEQDSKK